MTTSFTQKTLSLPARSRGAYLITDVLERELSSDLAAYSTGLMHVFLQHTSAALTLNENWDADVRADMSDALDRVAPEDVRGGRLYRHAAEGSDDMPAHIKSALVGASVTVPVTDGRMNLGTWQGVWFLEFRKARHERTVVVTIQGVKK
nr:upf0047 protein [Quercus suber]